MIIGEHAVIRSADLDDAHAFAALYDPTYPRSFMLDARRELQNPSPDEVRESLRLKEFRHGIFYVIEDRSGTVRGFSAVKTAGHEMSYAEMLCAFFDDSDSETPMASEFMRFIKRLCLVDRRLNKLIAQHLDNETGYGRLLEHEGFQLNGRQRQLLFTQGRYYDLLTYSLFRRDYEAACQNTATASQNGG